MTGKTRFSLLSLLIGLIFGAATPLAAQPTTTTTTAAAASAAPGGPFADWAGFAIAGDYRAHSGDPAEIFDNARRDMAKAFQALGIQPENIAQFSVRPDRYPGSGALASLPEPIIDRMVELTKKTQGGCIFFFTSHGSPAGILMGDYIVAPQDMAGLMQNTCGARPTVAIISACYSGVFIPALAGPNRMVLTAARPDRSSFGCGQDFVYTFFDQCVLESLPKAATFDALALDAKTCVTKREAELEASPPSEPQISIGPQFKLLMPLLHIGPGKVPPPATAAAPGAVPTAANTAGPGRS